MANLETIEDKLDQVLAMMPMIKRLCHRLGVDDITPTKVSDLAAQARKKAAKLKEKSDGNPTKT